MINSIQYYRESKITFQNVNGVWFSNATEISKAFNTRPGDWLRTDAAERYIKALAEVHKCTPSDLVIIKKGGDGIQGTWLHEDLTLAFAQWLSPEFYIWCNSKMKQLLTEGSVSLPNFNNPAEAARAWADQYEKRELAESKVQELSPKAEVFDRISNADNLLTMNAAAKSLGISRPKLFAVLRGRKVLMGNNLPYQLFIDKGLFQVKDKIIQMGERSMVYPQTFVTGKGVAWIGKGLIKLEKEA